MDQNNQIEHVVVLMLENRSFDHLMGYFPSANGLTGNSVTEDGFVQTSSCITCHSSAAVDVKGELHFSFAPTPPPPPVPDKFRSYNASQPRLGSLR